MFGAKVIDQNKLKAILKQYKSLQFIFISRKGKDRKMKLKSPSSFS